MGPFRIHVKRGHKKISVRDGKFRSGSCGVRVFDTSATFGLVTVLPAVSEPFSAKMAGWSIADGGFNARTGVMEASSVDSGKATLGAVFGDAVTLDVDLAIHDSYGGNVGVVLPANDLGSGANSYSGYYVGIECGRITLGRADHSWTEIKHHEMDISSDQIHHLRVCAVGPRFFIYLDDIVSARIIARDDTFKSGHIGARVFRSGASYDNFMIVKGVSL